MDVKIFRSNDLDELETAMREWFKYRYRIYLHQVKITTVPDGSFVVLVLYHHSDPEIA